MLQVQERPAQSGQNIHWRIFLYCNWFLVIMLFLDVLLADEKMLLLESSSEGHHTFVLKINICMRAILSLSLLIMIHPSIQLLIIIIMAL